MASSATTLHFLSLPTYLSSKNLTPTTTTLPSFSLLRTVKPISLVSKQARFVVRQVAEFENAVADTVPEEEEEEASFAPDLKLFVGNLPFTVDSATLAGVFERAGSVQMVEVIYDKLTGRSRGFGFVTMSTVEEVEAAVQQFNGYELEGRAMRVNSGPPPPKGESSFGSPRGGGGSFDNNNNKVYVGNLSWGVDDEALKTLFSEQGQVTEARVIYDRDSGRSKGFGFVTYSSSDEVNNAIQSLDGADLDGRSIRIEGYAPLLQHVGGVFRESRRRKAPQSVEKSVANVPITPCWDIIQSCNIFATDILGVRIGRSADFAIGVLLTM